MEIGLNPMETDEGRFVLASVVDIRPRKQAELELRRSNEELERFAYVASHDLQEPLRTVASYVQLLARRYRGKLDADADGVHRLRGRRRAPDAAPHRGPAGLLARGHAAARRSCPPTMRDACSTSALRQPARRASRNRARRSTRAIRCRWCVADARPARAALQNLIGNALKFRGDGAAATSHVGAERAGREWLFSVRDNGIGIEPEYFERIFVIFQRLHAREEYPGTGIGLAICKKIVERHGGRIWVESEPGEGATLLLHAAGEPRSERDMASASRARSRSCWSRTTRPTCG